MMDYDTRSTRWLGVRLLFAVFFPGGLTAPDMSLLFIYIQNLPHLIV